eukprot:TRINITY_DN101480_c0_g1_i1.p1 TRINITY_DN101480_c0_g1~~TRINITY_DN101480_c0_g1_i1.p1  ORF type:complete len:837 (+),score=227.14 TRINITY_DN101480_c0_g1_i1:82-2511(+)
MDGKSGQKRSGLENAGASAKQRRKDDEFLDFNTTGNITRNIEIPQSKVVNLIGASGATIKSIRTASGAQANLKQMSPRPDVATVIITGTPAEIERCKELVMKAVGMHDRRQPAVRAAAAAAASMGGGMLHLPGKTGPGGIPIRPRLTPGLLMKPGRPQGPNFPGVIAGLAEQGDSSSAGGNDIVAKLTNQALQKDLESQRGQPGQAFDREALARLAKQAAERAAREDASPTGDGGAAAPKKRRARADDDDAAESKPGGPMVMKATRKAGRNAAVANAFADMDGEEPEAPPSMPKKKDASSVLGILQMAQNNLARNRVTKNKANAPQPKGLEGIFGAEEDAGLRGVDAEIASLTGRLMEATQATITKDDREVLEKDAIGLLYQLEAPQTVDFVAKLHRADVLHTNDFLDILATQLVHFLPRLTSPQLAKVADKITQWALDLGGYPAEDGKPTVSDALKNFSKTVTDEVSLRLMDVTTGDMAKLAMSLSALGLAGMKLFASVARAAVARGDRFKPNEIVTLVNAFEQARFWHTGLYESMVRSIKTHIKDMDPKDVVRGMRALAAGNLKDESLGQVVADTIPRKVGVPNGLPAEEFCLLGWCFCALDLYHDNLFRQVFRALEDAAVMASETLCQLYEIHLTLRAFHRESYKSYELEDETVRSLRDHYFAQRGGLGLHPRMPPDLAPTLEEIAETVERQVDAKVATRHQTAQGFNVDIAASRKSRSSSSLVVVEIDGPHTLMRSLGSSDKDMFTQDWRLRGGVALKRRLLQHHGEKIAIMTETEWLGMGPSREKRNYVRERLQQAGLSEDRLR